MKNSEMLYLPAHQAAPLMLGGILSVNGVDLKITETEAYQGADDKASHAAKGRSVRNAPMFEQGGTLYVYLSYGMHWCFNIVTGEAGEASAVLLRAGEIIRGHEQAKLRRGKSQDPSFNLLKLASGPGNLTKALEVDGSFNGEPLGGRVTLSLPEGAHPYLQGPRIGISSEKLLPWRFYLEHPSISKGSTKKKS